MKSVPAFVIPLAFSALSAIQSNAYAENYFLKVDGITGEGKSDGHVGEIDVLSWSWELSQSNDIANPIVRPLTFSKRSSIASGPLYNMLLTGQKAKDAIFTAARSGTETDVVLLVITMTDVTVSAASSGGDDIDGSTVNISLNFSSACMKNIEFSPDASGKTVETCWTFGSK